VLDDVVPYLLCPLCGTDVALEHKAVRCERGHAFNVARHGYVSMLAGDAQTGTADTPAMVAAREALLSAGHYAPIAETVAAAVAQRLVVGPPGCVVDVGAGTGHYLAAVLDRLPARLGVALDLSKFALRRAARAHDRLGAVACDAWRGLPVRSGAAAAVLSLFAPRNGSEMHRVLHADGVLVVVTPTSRHLQEAVAALELLTVDPAKQERLDAALGPYFALGAEERLQWTMTLDRAAVAAVAQMGPSAHHTDPAGQIGALPDPLTVTASVTVAQYRPRP
jgi:23S rRNA (guanine745-N1)-methyltransferase